MMKLAVCDDEPYVLENIANQIAQYLDSKGLSYQLSRFSSGKELLQSQQMFDLFFLDIQMDDMDGMETARRIRKLGCDGFIIFITALKEYVFDSFEVEAYDYLLKPLEDDRFLHTMKRVLNALDKRIRKNIIVQKGTTFQVVPLDEIVYCEVLGRKIYLHTTCHKVVDYYCRLEDLKKAVDQRFFRCHRSYLINLDCVRGLKEGNVFLQDGGTIPVSRLRERELTQALLSHMKERKR